nr:mitochondrial ferredoxin [Chlamydomonas sp. UWO 241]
MLRSAASLLPSAFLRSTSSAASSSGHADVLVSGGLIGGLLRCAQAWRTDARSPMEVSGLHSSARAAHGGGPSKGGEGTISVTFIDKDDSEHTVFAPIGTNLLEVAHDNEIDLEGACEASLACSTCHLIVENEEYYKRLPEASEDELDMLDLAFALTETSRLGCQIIAAKDIDGIRVRIPSATRNFYVDGHKPKPH